MSLLRAEVVNLLERRIKIQKMDCPMSLKLSVTNRIQTQTPIMNLNQSFETKQGVKSQFQIDQPAEPRAAGEKKRCLPADGGGGFEPGRLEIVPVRTAGVHACPQILDYGPGRCGQSVEYLMSAAVVVRSMLGVSASSRLPGRMFW